MNTKYEIGYQQFFGFEERQYLQTSLAIVQKENHLKNIFVWGRIFTCENDYVVAFGYVDDVLKTRKFFYTYVRKSILFSVKPPQLLNRLSHL